MDVLNLVLDVFTDVGTWFSVFVGELTNMFYIPGTGDTQGTLTFLGVLSVAGLAISVVFLIIGVISNFLHFRG